MSEIVLDLPPPISVNRTRRIDWHNHAAVKRWKIHANKLLMIARVKPARLERFEVLIVLDEATVSCDADNSAKTIIDYLRVIEMIVDDSKKHMRRVTVEWGKAQMGCQVTLRPMP